MVGSGLVEGAPRISKAMVSKRVAGEDRGRLVKGLVHGRAAPAQVVVIHRRQIVMHERVAMHAFERASGVERGLLAHAEQVCATASGEKGRSRLPPPSTA